MKNKIFAIALSILMAACLTACKGATPDSQPGSNSQSSSSSASASSQNLELLYGRVSEVAGNELTLDLAKLPGEDEAASAPENADGEVAAAVMAPAMEAGEAGGQTGASERTELDYTGESKSVVISRRAEDHRCKRRGKAAHRYPEGQHSGRICQRERAGHRGGPV